MEEGEIKLNFILLEGKLRVRELLEDLLIWDPP